MSTEQLPLSTWDDPKLLGSCACGHGWLEHGPCRCKESCIDHMGSCQWCGCTDAQPPYPWPMSNVPTRTRRARITADTTGDRS